MNFLIYGKEYNISVCRYVRIQAGSGIETWEDILSVEAGTGLKGHAHQHANTTLGPHPPQSATAQHPQKSTRWVISRDILMHVVCNTVLYSVMNSKLSIFFSFSLLGASLPGRDKWCMWIQTRTTSRPTCMTIVFTMIELSIQSSQQCPLCVCNRLLHVCKQQPVCVLASFPDFPIPHTQLEMRLTTLHDVLFVSN